MELWGGVLPMLIGKGIPSEYFLASAYGAGVEVYGWKERNNKISIWNIEPENHYEAPSIEHDWLPDIMSLLNVDMDRVIDYEMMQSFFSPILGNGNPYHVELAGGDDK